MYKVGNFMNRFIVAIDGPAGSGKSSISKLVAQKRKFIHLDTGAMYRAVTLEALNRKIDLADEKCYDFLNDISIIYKDSKTYLNGVDVSKEIRSELVTANVSTVAKLKVVRDKMVFFQRESAKTGKVIVDGRDIGTVVLPNADLKIFLTASAEERAKRRFLENKEMVIDIDYETILKEIKERDYKDSNREIAPLKKASDAIELDTTKMTIAEVCNFIIKLIDERLNSMESFEMKELCESYAKYQRENRIINTLDNLNNLRVTIPLGLPSKKVVEEASRAAERRAQDLANEIMPEKKMTDEEIAKAVDNLDKQFEGL